MKKHAYTAGVFVLALVMSGLPTIALAERNGDAAREDASTEMEIETQEETIRQDVSVQDDTQPSEGRLKRMSSDWRELKLEDDEDRAMSFHDLEQKIEMRRHELDDEEASTTPKFKEVMKNANPVRLAVHSLLAAKDLLGGIGSEVSVIAKSMNDSIATTTRAEAKMRSRGFFARLFFGGDSAAADMISQEVAGNQQRIDMLSKMFSEANVPVDMQATLTAQMMAIQEAQARLQELAQEERGMWGLFSWRF